MSDNPIWAEDTRLMQEAGVTIDPATATATSVSRGYDLVSEQEVTGTFTVEPGGSAVVREVG